MQQELIEMLEKMVDNVVFCNGHDQRFTSTNYGVNILKEAEALVEKAKNSAKEPAVPQGLQWFTVAEHGIPEIGAEVIGGLWYTDPWLKSEFATTFMWGQCRVLENKGRDFKDGKQWRTFGPSHNQITHWARINNPGEVATPATAPSQPVMLTDEEIKRNWSGGACPPWGIKFARAIIAALRKKEQA